MIHAGIFADIILQLVETSTTKLTEASTCRFSPPTEDRTGFTSNQIGIRSLERCAVQSRS